MPRMLMSEQLELALAVLPQDGSEMLYTDFQNAAIKNEAYDVARMGYALKQHGVRFRTQVNADGSFALYAHKEG